MAPKQLAKWLLRSNRVTDGALRWWLSRPQQLTVDGVTFSVADRSRSSGHYSLVREFLRDEYGLRTIPFEPGDVVIDIGAHVGIETIYLAKRYPFLQIYAYEPVSENFESLRQNLATNAVTNVHAFPQAVTGDGREITIWVDLTENSAGGGHDRPEEHFRGRTPRSAPSVTLDQIFAEHEVARCKLLKIDCEGAEHEVLRASSNLARVDYLSGEFHVDAHLRAHGHTIDGLIEHCTRFVPRDRIRIVRDEQG